MYNKDLAVNLLFTFLILCLIYGFIFQLELVRNFSRILFILYMPDTRVGIIITLLGIYIVYIIKKKNITNGLRPNRAYHFVFAVSIALFMNGMLKLLSEVWLVNRLLS